MPGSGPATNTLGRLAITAGFQRWGVEGALKYFYERNDLAIRAAGDPDAAALRAGQRAAVLSWDPVRARLDIVY